MPTILDVNFLGGAETLEKQGRKIRYQTSPSKFAGNFLKIRRAKIKNSPQIRSAERRDQDLGSVARSSRTEIRNIEGRRRKFWEVRVGAALTLYMYTLSTLV